MTREEESETASQRKPQVNLSEKRLSQGSREKSHESMQEEGGTELGVIVLLSCFRTCTSCQWVAECACMIRNWTVEIARNLIRREDGEIAIFVCVCVSEGVMITNK